MSFDLEIFLIFLWLTPGLVLLVRAVHHDMSRGVFSVRTLVMTSVLCLIPIFNIVILSRVSQIIKTRK